MITFLERRGFAQAFPDDIVPDTPARRRFPLPSSFTVADEDPFFTTSQISGFGAAFAAPSKWSKRWYVFVPLLVVVAVGFP